MQAFIQTKVLFSRKRSRITGNYSTTLRTLILPFLSFLQESSKGRLSSLRDSCNQQEQYQTILQRQQNYYLLG
uniref:Uncharacterized protein n=1 Tax=Arundo donax TaxID=35708 RepID=A0A0A9DFI3_ARUDO